LIPDLGTPIDSHHEFLTDGIHRIASIDESFEQLFGIFLAVNQRLLGKREQRSSEGREDDLGQGHGARQRSM